MEMFSIMKNILTRVYFHPLFLISALLLTLMGYFKLINYFMITIVIHELGHIITSGVFKWKIDKIIILPLGGLIKFDKMINVPLIQDFVVAISGVLFQMIFYLLIREYISYKYFSIINYFILIFNLMPIYPLDGSKILNILFNIVTSYKNSIILTCTVSYFFILVFIVITFSLNKFICFTSIFLILEVNKLYNDKYNLFNKFLLERYINKINFKHEKIIRRIKDMKRDYRHIFYIDNKYITESQVLKKAFDINNKV